MMVKIKNTGFDVANITELERLLYLYKVISQSPYRVKTLVLNLMILMTSLKLSQKYYSLTSCSAWPCTGFVK